MERDVAAGPVRRRRAGVVLGACVGVIAYSGLLFAGIALGSLPIVIATLFTAPLMLAVLLAFRLRSKARLIDRLGAELENATIERREMLDRVVQLIEDDRQRFATDMREEAIAPLTTFGTLIQTAYLSLPANTPRESKEAIAEIQHDLSSRAQALRQILMAVDPPVLDDGGLLGALTAYAGELFGDRSGTLVDVVVDPRLTLDRTAAAIAFRIVQAALDNVAQHAAAPSIKIEIRAHNGRISLGVVDDGVGFDAHTVAAGRGLSAMRDFAGLGRGHVSIESQPGMGTSIRAVLDVLDEGRRAAGPYPGSPTPKTWSRPSKFVKIDRATSSK